MVVSMESSEKAGEFGDDGTEWSDNLDRSWTKRRKFWGDGECRFCRCCMAGAELLTKNICQKDYSTAPASQGDDMWCTGAWFPFWMGYIKFCWIGCVGGAIVLK